MQQQNLSLWNNLRYDLPAAIVVVLVALPLCLGIALASGAPLMSGIIAGVVGGIVIGCLSKSPLSVSGPAAGLNVIVLDAIHSLPNFNAFLLAVCLAGALQIGFGLLRAGVIGDFIPSAVIKGMLAAIGIILILKQLPHAIGYDANHDVGYEFYQSNGENTFSALWHMLEAHVTFGAIIISTISLAFLFWWDKRQSKMTNWLRYLPGPLVVVIFGVVMNILYNQFFPALVLAPEHLVAVPVAAHPLAFFQQFTFPDFDFIKDQAVWIAAVTLALVASIETLLSIEAIDKLDPFKRVTPTSRELLAQGAGNIVSGLIGGLPVTSVIVRSSANAAAGGRTNLAAILHGILLLLMVVSIPALLNYIPLAALAAVLIAVGYKLTKPAIFFQKYDKGLATFVPFIVTIGAILVSDLLIGIAVGVVVGSVFVMRENFRSAIIYVADGGNHLIRCQKDLFFIHKYELKRCFARLPTNCQVLVDLTRVNHIDHDNIEIINDFMAGAPFKNITVTLKNNVDAHANAFIRKPITNAAL